jgi:phage tail sheath protein FI
MPATFTHPGIYVEEIPSGVHPIVGASTADTAFVDYFARGPAQATRVTSLEEFDTLFGGLDRQSEGSYGVRAYYQNGGQVAWIVRVLPAAAPAVATLDVPSEGSPPQATLRVDAASAGAWGSRLQVAATPTVPAEAGRFNLFVREVLREDTGPRVVATEVYRGLSMSTTDARYAVSVVNAGSTLVRATDPGLGQPPVLGAAGPTGDPDDAAWRPLSTVADPVVYGTDGQAVAGFDAALTTGIRALDRIDPFHVNLLCLPAASRLPAAAAKTLLDTASAWALGKRAMLVVDPPPSTAVGSPTAMQTWALGPTGPAPTPNGAVYYPRVAVTDPADGNRLREIGPSGVVAGIYARTDSARGVWKAPAGLDATVRGATLVANLNDADSGRLNPLGVNALRVLPVIGTTVWGARTLFGADQRASEWKYVPVRRTALYIETSLVDGLGWVVFEPNDETLWAQVRLNVGAFMQDLFRQGAFQGTSPRDAYLVKCDRTTTTQSDIDRGIVNILVGFAPLKPAEFVVLRIQQLAGQSQS